MEMKIRVIAIDDEVPALDLLCMFIQRNSSLELVGQFSSVAPAMKFLENTPVDLVISDIEMPEIDGLTLAKNLPGQTKIIFSTAYDNYAIQGFHLSAVDYLLKPYSIDRFQRAIEKAKDTIRMEQLKEQLAETIVVKVNYANRTIRLNDILYIESMNNNLQIHLKDKSILSFRESLKHIQGLLPNNQFFRIHRSFIVPRHRITAFNGQRVLIHECELPISAPYKNDFLNWMNS